MATHVPYQARDSAAPDVVYVEWVDAASDNGWMHPSRADMRLLKMDTCGFLVEETDDRITITNTVAPLGGINGYISIPKRWIVKRKKIRL